MVASNSGLAGKMQVLGGALADWLDAGGELSGAV
jgi:hypothetical protein